MNMTIISLIFKSNNKQVCMIIRTGFYKMYLKAGRWQKSPPVTVILHDFAVCFSNICTYAHVYTVYQEIDAMKIKKFQSEYDNDTLVISSIQIIKA